MTDVATHPLEIMLGAAARLMSTDDLAAAIKVALQAHDIAAAQGDVVRAAQAALLLSKCHSNARENAAARTWSERALGWAQGLSLGDIGARAPTPPTGALRDLAAQACAVLAAACAQERQALSSCRALQAAQRLLGDESSQETRDTVYTGGALAYMVLGLAPMALDMARWGLAPETGERRAPQVQITKRANFLFIAETVHEQQVMARPAEAASLLHEMRTHLEGVQVMAAHLGTRKAKTTHAELAALVECAAGRFELARHWLDEALAHQLSVPWWRQIDFKVLGADIEAGLGHAQAASQLGHEGLALLDAAAQRGDALPTLWRAEHRLAMHTRDFERAARVAQLNHARAVTASHAAIQAVQDERQASVEAAHAQAAHTRRGCTALEPGAAAPLPELRTDPLTGCATRHALMDDAARWPPAGALLVQLRGATRISHTHSQLVADQSLRLLSDALRGAVQQLGADAPGAAPGAATEGDASSSPPAQALALGRWSAEGFVVLVRSPDDRALGRWSSAIGQACKDIGWDRVAPELRVTVQISGVWLWPSEALDDAVDRARTRLRGSADTGMQIRIETRRLRAVGEDG